MSTTDSNEDLRSQLRHIVTRGGLHARIPEMLEDELDKLESLFTSHIQTICEDIIGEGISIKARQTGSHHRSLMYNIVKSEIRQRLAIRLGKDKEKMT